MQTSRLTGHGRRVGLGLALVLIGSIPLRSQDFQPEIQPLPKQLATYEEMKIPADNPLTPEKVALGRQLFFDKRLSVDGTRSCYSCHLCEKGLTDGKPKAIGVGDKPLKRSSPSLWNIGYHKEFYWDGRSASLEAQGAAAWRGGNMGAQGKENEIVAKINAIPGYKKQFQSIFKSDATVDNIFKAITSFERTIISGDTAYDRFKAGNKKAMTKDQQAGWKLFQDLKCNNCHDGVLFTDQQYHNVGVGMDGEKAEDAGRFDKTKKVEDTGAFKTPTLRDITKSAPYFHDGSVKTLEEAVDFMLGGGKDNKYLDKKNLERRKTTPAQRKNLLAFLKALDVDCKLTAPKLP